MVGLRERVAVRESTYRGQEMDIKQGDLQRLFDFTRPHICGLMARLIYATGIRLKEVVEIRVSDVDFGEQQIKVRRSRDEFDRAVYFPECLAPELQALARQRQTGDYLFSLRRNTAGEVMPVSRRTLQIFLTNSSEKLELPKITAETLRMLYAMHLLRQGVDPRRLKDSMGFKNSQPIQRFVKSIPDREIRIGSPLNEPVPADPAFEASPQMEADEVAIQAS